MEKIISVLLSLALCLGMCPPVAMAAGEINIGSSRENILTAEAGGCPGHTFTGTAEGAIIYVESGTHDVTFSNLKITGTANVGVAPNATMNLAIDGTNTIHAGGNLAGIYVPVGATLVINGTGSLNVSGNGGGAGIGGAVYAHDESGSDGDPNCGTVVINGGAITATGGNFCTAGIGGGTTDDVPGNGGTVTINGGKVTATGGSDNYYGGAGIGGGGGVLNEWSELVSGSGGTLTINGGHVTLAPGQYDSTNSTAYGFGRGSSDPNTSTGTYELTLVDASYLDSGTTLDPKGKYTINGDPTADMIVVPELVYTGQALDTSGIKIDDNKTGTGTYFGQTFTVKASAEGWELQDLGEVKVAGEYTAVFKKGDKQISKTFTVAKSGTDLTEGKVQTYNGDTPTKDFTAGDTITVKAMPTATGTAPQRAAARLRGGYTAPTAGQMAVYVGEKQVSIPASAGEDGSYTMEVSAAEVLTLGEVEPNGDAITLTAKFVENDNMADGEGTATVNITAAAKAERDGAVIGYYGESNLAAAFADNGNAGATITLLADVERVFSLDIYIDCTLDLNGHTITAGDNLCVSIRENTSVTIRGEGEIISKSIALSVDGSVTLEGGTYTSTGSEDFSHGVQVGVSATLSVTGINVVIQNTGGSSGLNVEAAQSSVRLSAGTYSGAKAIESIVPFSDMLAHTDSTRYAFFQNDIPVTKASAWVDGNISDVPLDTSIAWLSGTVTVKACTHAYQYAHTPGATTHSQTCPACGDAKASEKCDFSNGPCPCGAVLAVKLPADLNLTYNGTEQKPAVTVTVDGQTLAAENNYTVTYADNINAGGTAKATVTGTSFTGTTTLTFSIGKATPTIAWANNNVELTYTGEPANIKPTVTLVNDETFNGTITYSYGTYSGPDLPTNVGTYSIKTSITEQNNYTAAGTDVDLSLTITKADQTAPAAPTATEDNIKDTSITLNTITNGEYKMESGEWQESPTFTGLEPNRAYTFYARLKGDDNHNASPSSEASITTKKTMLENGFVMANKIFTYTGAAIVPSVGDVDVMVNGKKVDSNQYTISVSNNTNAGTAELTVTAKETGNYSGTASGTFTINRAALTVKANDQTITYGESIATSTDQVTPTGLVTGDTLESVTLTPSSNQVAVADKTITPSTAVIKRGGEDVTTNYNITYQPGTLTINKSKPTIAFAGGYNPSKTYDGQAISNPVADNLDITGANYSDVTFEWSATPKDAGTYTLTAKIEATDNTEAAHTAPLTVTISPKEVSNPTIELSQSTFVYDGTAKEPTVTVKDSGTVIPNSEYTVEYSNNTNVGESATVTITDKAGGNYTVNGTNTFAITKAAQAPLTITGAPSSVTYGDTFQLGVSGGSGTGAVSWATSGATVDNAGNVTITRAGTVAITAVKEGDSNYVGTEGRIMLDVSKKNLTVTGATVTGRKYNGTNTVEITAVALDGKVGSDDVSVNTTDLTGTLNGSNAGDYTAVTLPTLTLTGGKADNYTLTQPTGAVSANVKIQKADALTPKTGDLAVANKQAHTYTFGLGALLPDVPEGKSFGSSAVIYELGTVSLDGYYTTGAKIDGQTLTLPIVAVESITEGKIGTVKIIIKTGNYEDMTATINVQSVNKIIPTGAPTLSAATITYGQPISTITLSGSMMDGEEPVPGTFQWSSPENRPAAQDSYAAAWVFTPTDDEKYAKVNGTSAVKVLPAPIASAVIELKPTVFKYDDSAHKPTIESVKLGDVALADTDYTAEIPEGTEVGSYTVTVTGKGNYTGTATAKYTINPVEQKPLDMTDKDGHELRLEVETGLSTVPAALESNTSLNTPEKITTALQTKVTEMMADAGKQISVLDVTLQYKDGGVWKKVEPGNFPADGVTAVLPYPEGTGASGYTFTVQHLVSSGPNAGTIETLKYELTSDGLKCKFNSLSPVAIGYKKNPSSGGSSGGGWYPSVSYYSVKVDKTEHGIVTASPTSASSGSTITLTVKPDEGYKLDKITVTDSQGKTVESTEKNGKYTFKMPSRDVTIKADFVPAVSPSPEPTGSPSPSPSGSPTPTTSPSPSPKPWKNPFPDVSNTGWYIKAVEYVCTNGLMAGYSNGKFGPNDDLTRAQFAQIIYNKEGRPKAGSGRFTDVTTGWYADAVNWAAAERIVAGIGGGKFAPDRPITRQDLAVMLWRYAGSPEPRKNELDFSDAGKTSEYAWKALCWANENGIVNGKGSGILDPKGKATRAEAAQMLMNYLKK